MIAITTSSSTSVNACRRSIRRRSKYSSMHSGIVFFIPRPILHSCQLQRFCESTLELLVGNLRHGAQVRCDAARAARAFLLVRNHMVKFPLDVLIVDHKWLAVAMRQQ